MSRRKHRQSCPRRLGCETGYARGERGGSWWLPLEDADSALFDIWPVTIDEAFAGPVANFRARKGVPEDRVDTHERVKTKSARVLSTNTSISESSLPSSRAWEPKRYNAATP